MKKVMEKMEWLLEIGGTKRDITFLIFVRHCPYYQYF